MRRFSYMIIMSIKKFGMGWGWEVLLNAVFQLSMDFSYPGIPLLY